MRPAIETPRSSVARGDWGLKRPLPSKSTTTSSSSPVVRVNNLDTFEHITDFESAADHTVTLEKWQELSFPISLTKPPGISVRQGGGHHQSVFESASDNSHESTSLESPNPQRQRFKGPWLAGKTEMQFEG